MVLNELTLEEKHIIEDKGTERPYKRCDNPLYTSKTKFDAGCGWPAFDDHFPGSVREIKGPLSIWTEIECAKCGGHLGHVFVGEQLTDKNTRHCVNSLSIKFLPEN